MSPNRRLIIWSLLLTASMLGLAILNLSTGTMTISWPALLGILTGRGNATDMLVLVNFRLPRIVLAIMVGWALALSGNVLQTVTNNPMADPSLLGINNGAGLAVMLLIIGAGTNASLTLSLPIVALAGAWLSTALIFLLANQRQRGISSKRLLLVGVALSGCFSALMVLMTLNYHLITINLS